MAFLKKLFGGRDPNNVDYYREGLELLRASKYHEALTSFRLAQRDAPADDAIAQQIAITYTRIGMTDEAMKTYRGVLERKPNAPGAHYGLAFLMLREGRQPEAVEHLEAFLANAPGSPDAERHIQHARDTLEELKRGPAEAAVDVDGG